MSILEVVISITVMGMIGIVIGSSFSAIRAAHEVGDDLVDARRLIALQFSIFDEMFSFARRYPTPSESRALADAFNWGQSPPYPPPLAYLPTQIRRPAGGTPFPDLWDPARPVYTIGMTDLAPQPSLVESSYRARGPGRENISELANVVTLTDVHAWHAFSALQVAEQTRLRNRELNLLVYLARLDINDTQVLPTGPFVPSPYRYRVGRENMWWIAQADVVRGAGANARIIQTAFRIGP